jgi:hypothetical protein
MFPQVYIWDGIVKTAPLQIKEDAIQQRIELFSRAKTGQWIEVFNLLPEDNVRLNTVKGHHITEPDDYSLNTLLHYAALTNASLDTVNRLVQSGASRTRRNAQRQRAVDIATEQGHHHLIQPLQPKLAREISSDTIQRLEERFHEFLRYPPNDPYQLPQVEVLLEGYYDSAYFPIIGMYGGFNYSFMDDSEIALTVHVESRIVAGSAQNYKITVSRVETLD